MNREYSVIVDSMADFPIGYTNPDLVVIETPVTIGDKDYTFSTPDDFYHQQVETFEENKSKKPLERTRISTSAPNIFRTQDEMLKIIEKGKDAIYVATASSLTSAFLSGKCAVDNILEDTTTDYKGKRAIAVDGLSMSALTALLVQTAMDLCTTTDQFISFILDKRNDTEHFFAVQEWEAFRNSGRIPDRVLMLAKILHIKPLMRFDYNERGGREAFCEQKHRQFKRLMKYAAEKMYETIDPLFPKCKIIHANNPEAAEMLYDEVKTVMPEIEIEYNLINGRMGPATGVHLGYSAVGLGFLRRKGIYPNAEHHREMQDISESVYG